MQGNPSCKQKNPCTSGNVRRDDAAMAWPTVRPRKAKLWKRHPGFS
ncbi:hypothetical protein HUG20_04145 [Salicibibacter cibi]|uniref:Uncharacterized protein n=1 Tax=Salicibibacter cibi TaxID=2743001 RepID=A0A7T7CEK9_9BACI|nr:hypothetical protein [Salicibibacter cibi]QQK79174.1 hypothetical protein HUG20_04145 [Salicibibacter cibi]